MPLKLAIDRRAVRPYRKQAAATIGNVRNNKLKSENSMFYNFFIVGFIISYTILHVIINLYWLFCLAFGFAKKKMLYLKQSVKSGKQL